MERRLGFIHLVCFVGGLMVIGIQGCLRPSARDAEQRVLETLRDYYAEFSAENWDGVEQLFWPEADIVTIWRPPAEKRAAVIATPIETLRRGATARSDQVRFEEWLVDADVRTVGDLAQAWVRHGARYAAGDSTERVWAGVDTFTLIALDGEWRISSLTFGGRDDASEER